MGKPVVPEVYWMLMGSSKSREHCRPQSTPSGISSPIFSISSQENMPGCFSPLIKMTDFRNGKFSELICPGFDVLSFRADLVDHGDVVGCLEPVDEQQRLRLLTGVARIRAHGSCKRG